MSLHNRLCICFFFFFFQAEDGIRDYKVTGVQTCALPIYIDNVALFDVALGDGGASVGQAAAPGSAIDQLFQQGAASLLSGIPTNAPVVVTNPPLTGTMLISELQLAGGQGVLSISNTTGTRYSVQQATNLPNGWRTIATTQ